MPFGGEVGPGNIVLDGDPALKGAQPPSFQSMSVVAKRSSISATAAPLYKQLPKHFCSFFSINYGYPVE